MCSHLDSLPASTKAVTRALPRPVEGALGVGTANWGFWLQNHMRLGEIYIREGHFHAHHVNDPMA